MEIADADDDARGKRRRKKVKYVNEHDDGSEDEQQALVEKKRRARQLDSELRVDVGYPLLEQIVGRRMNHRSGTTEYLCKFLGRSYLHLYWLTFDELELFIPDGYQKYHRVQNYERKLRRDGYQDLDDVDDVEANKVTIEKILSHKVDPRGHLDEQIEKRRKQSKVPKRYPRVTDRFLLDNGDALQERMMGIVKKLLNENGGEIFAQPVSIDDVPEYLNVIANPMDLGSISTRLLRESYYVGPSALSLFSADVRLVFNNCKTFNDESSDIWTLADEMLKAFEKWLYEWILCPTAWLKLMPSGNAEEDRKLAKKFRHDCEDAFDLWSPWQIGCSICRSNADSDQLLLCDRCDGEIHMFCSTPALTELPEGEWYCQFCEARTSYEAQAQTKRDEHNKQLQAREAVELSVTTAPTSPKAADASNALVPSILCEPVEEEKKFNRNVAGRQTPSGAKSASGSGVHDRATFFLVKWVGLSIRYSTWERPEDIGDDEQIQRYFKFSRLPTIKEIRETTCQLPCCARRNQLLLNSVAHRVCEKDKFCTRGYEHEGDCSREIKTTGADKAYGTHAYRHLRMVEQVKAQLFAFHCLLNNHTPDKEVLKQCGVFTNAFVCKKQYLHASLKAGVTTMRDDQDDEDYSGGESSESDEDNFEDEVDEEGVGFGFQRAAARATLYSGMMNDGDDDEDDEASLSRKKTEDQVSEVLGAMVEHIALGYPTEPLEKTVHKVTYNSAFPVSAFKGVKTFTEYGIALPRTPLGLGMRIGAAEDGTSVVLGFQRLSNGMMGPAEASQAITGGDVVAAVNNVSVAGNPFKDVIALIARSSTMVTFHLHSNRPAHLYPPFCHARTVTMKREGQLDHAAEPSEFIPYSYNQFKPVLTIGATPVSPALSSAIVSSNFLTPTGPMQHLYAGIVDNSIDPHEHFASFLPADRATKPVKAKKTDKNDFVPYEQSPTFKDSRTLRPYQVEGLNWMVTCWKQQRSCILADEMGLGKTVQVVSLIEHLRAEESIRGPYLVVVPLSTIQHWRREIESWTDLNVCVYHDIGDHRGAKFTAKDMRAVIRNQEWYYPGLPNAIFRFHILLTTFETVLADFEDFEQIHWRMLVVDEAHRLKSAGSRVLKQMRGLHCDRKLLLTGTPLQNNTQELWVLLNFMEPVKFDNMDDFNQKFGKLQSQEQVVQLQKLLGPYLLRRIKEDVEKSIPPKEETIISVELTTLQKQYYRAIYDKNKSFLYRGTKNSLPTLNNIQLQLRKCCNHPFLIKGVEERELGELGDAPNAAAIMDKTVQCSGKMVLVSKLLPKLKREGHKVLIFSQFLKQLDLLERYCEANSFGFERLDGTTSGSIRQNAIDRFSRPNSKTFVFLLSTKAGGVGINLIAADTVIIFDSDWNPQNDLQAQARCHRIGQKKSVQIYRLVTRNTYESEMFDRASRKLGLEHAVLGTASFNEAAEQMEKPSAEQLVELLKRGAYALIEEDDTASKQFADRDIETILKENARVRVVGPSGEKTEDDEQKLRTTPQKTRKRKSLAGIAFDRSSFIADGSTDLSVDDPNFWEKVLPGAMSVEMLSVKLEDGSALASRQSKIKFINNLDISLGELVAGIKAAADDENGVSSRTASNLEHEYGVAIQVLHRITTKHKNDFSNDQFDLVKSYLGKLEKSRVRSCRVLPTKKDPATPELGPGKKKRAKVANGSSRHQASDEEIDLSSDEDPFDDDDEGNRKKGKRGRPPKSKLTPGQAPPRSSLTKSPSKPQKLTTAQSPMDVAGMFPSGAINDSDDLCTLCGDGGLILLCDGPCHRSFHLECIGMDAEPDDDKWLCPDCSAGRHMCLICKQVGEMGAEFGVMQCSVAKCGRFYHKGCLSKHERAEWLGKKRFRCPSHFCHGCPQDKQLTALASAAKQAIKTKKAPKVEAVVSCIHCSNSFHDRCMKPTNNVVRLSPSLMVCGNHLRPSKPAARAAPAKTSPPVSVLMADTAPAKQTTPVKTKPRARDRDDDADDDEDASAKKKAKVIVPAVKACALCHRKEEKSKDGKPAIEGPFIEAPVRFKNQDKSNEQVYLHLNCALHSPEVYVKPDGTFCHLVQAIKRGRQLPCTKCKGRGATVGCVVDKCRRNYHLRCAVESGGEFIGSPYTLYCMEHAEEKHHEPRTYCSCNTQDGNDPSLTLECGSCQTRFHAKCVNMSERQAQRKSKDKNWLCASCSGEATKDPKARSTVTTQLSRRAEPPPAVALAPPPAKEKEQSPPPKKTTRPPAKPVKKSEPEEEHDDDTANVDEEAVSARAARTNRRASLSPPMPTRQAGRKRSRKPMAPKKVTLVSPHLENDEDAFDEDDE